MKINSAIKGTPQIFRPQFQNRGQFFVLLSLLRQWALENPVIELAQEITKSPSQSIALAMSLMKLVDQIETEEVGLTKIGEAYEVELSEHRNSILSLLSIIRLNLPKILHDENLLGHAERRSLALRLEANAIARGQRKGPIIAAGSTGTIPATRELLRAISQHSAGAVILPGLDQNLDDLAWQSIKPDHPQFALANMLSEFEITRADVPTLSLGNGNRNFLASELMRPTETTDQWKDILVAHKSSVAKAIDGIKVIEAPDRHLEARSIALILRNAADKPGRTAALVTPDRDLAKRVRAELKRWNININDSAGEPLTNSGLAALAQLLVEAIEADLSPASILALLHHPDCNLGLARNELLQHLSQLEIAVLRDYDIGNGLDNLQAAFVRARLVRQNGDRCHPLVSKLSETDWQNIQNLISGFKVALEPLINADELPFKLQLSKFVACLKVLVPHYDQLIVENPTFEKLINEIDLESHRLPASNFRDAAKIILNILRGETAVSNAPSHPRLAIYGLLEARMLPADILVMGGLNETKWPATSDPGPWLNRKMRDILGLQQPEREIGVAAHDFAQGLGYREVYLTWSKRVDAAPLVPSRWILRLRAVLQSSGIDMQDLADESWLTLARAVDDAQTLLPTDKPRPTPPLSARPNRISVTEVEKLIRDPYAIYARRILRLEPLPPLAKPADAALRGTLFHNAINEWNRAQAVQLSSDSLEILMRAGESVFSPHLSNSEIASFWWPRFQKMAHWLCAVETDYRAGTRDSKTETAGELSMPLPSRDHTLQGRADRIDILANGLARIIDYKTGKPPTQQQVTTGLSPQLPLEAAILAYGKFEGLDQFKTQSLDYIHISGGSVAGTIERVSPKDGSTISELMERQLAGLKKLLTSYDQPNQAYLPRVAPLKEDGELDYDHLSRFREWMLSGGKT